RTYDRNRPCPDGVRSPIKSNWKIYTINNEIAVDYIAKLENIDDDLNYARKKLNLPIDLGQIKAKKDIRSKQKKLKDFYNERCDELVRIIYKNEIKHFGYKFPP